MDSLSEIENLGRRAKNEDVGSNINYREDSNRERVRLKRARDGSDEQTDQYITVALSVRSSLLLANKLIFTSPLLSS